jgi:hypothetical protein
LESKCKSLPLYLPSLRALYIKHWSALIPSLVLRDSAVYIIFVCCLCRSKLMKLSPCARSHTAFSVYHSLGTILLWQTTSIVKTEEGVVTSERGRRRLRLWSCLTANCSDRRVICSYAIHVFTTIALTTFVKVFFWRRVTEEFAFS